MRKFFGPMGSVSRLSVDSQALRSNMLGDPSVRVLDVYLPAGHDGQGLPLLVDLVGFTSSGLSHTNWVGFRENLPERLDRLIGEQRMPPVVVAFPDCFTRLGGNQYINSASTGPWEDYLLYEMLPVIERRYGCGGPGHRGVFGKSSGGYGALTHALHHADIWAAATCHSGDMGFELCYLPDMPAVLRALAGCESSIERWWHQLEAARKHPDGSGKLAVACLADVPGLPVLGRSAEGALAVVRAPATGELYRHHLDRLAWMDELVGHHGVRRALSAADLETAHRTGQPAIIGDVEGLDFLDGKLERLEEAHQRGLRHLQLVHYTPNDIGDFQTGTITHDGLTDFGAEVIRACHRLGFVCDVAHATEEMTKQAVKVATKPLLLSHTALAGSPAMGPTPLAGRQISPDHARAIAETGGSIGIWHFFPSLEKYVEGIKEMTDIVGVDHVSMGTDQFDARGCVEDYTRWVHLIAAMLRGGFTSEETGKIAGGNYLRIFRAAVG